MSRLAARVVRTTSRLPLRMAGKSRGPEFILEVGQGVAIVLVSHRDSTMRVTDTVIRV